MQNMLSFIRGFFLILCVSVLTLYITNYSAGGFSSTNVMFGIVLGLAAGFGCMFLDILMKKWNLRAFNIAILGVFLGYVMANMLWMLVDAALNLGQIHAATETLTLCKTVLFLVSSYFALVFTARAANELHLSIPFFRFNAITSKKRDLLVDWTVLLDARIVEIASSGLLDSQLVVPHLVLKELHLMIESADEGIQMKGRRCLEVLKKLETIPSLEMRYTNDDFADLRELPVKLMQLAHQLEANILTSEAARFQTFVTGYVRIINIQMLSTALKPITGESLSVKIQRYGKEARQGVGYLDDGTMVVVNGGAEFIGEMVKAHVLSVKHTASGRMIFCNVMDELEEASMRHGGAEIESAKPYFTL